MRCQAIAAPPAKEAPSAPAAQGPIIMNGQILHSSTEKQLELVRGLSQSGYLQKQVRQKQHAGTTRGYIRQTVGLTVSWCACRCCLC